jgi:hypothetical protein
MTFLKENFGYYAINSICMGISFLHAYQAAKTGKKRYKEIQEEKLYGESLTLSEKVELITHVAMSCLSLLSTVFMSIPFSKELQYVFFSSDKIFNHLKTYPFSRSFSISQFEFFLKRARWITTLGHICMKTLILMQNGERTDLSCMDAFLKTHIVFFIPFTLGERSTSPIGLKERFLITRILDTLVKSMDHRYQKQKKHFFPEAISSKDLPNYIPEKWHTDPILSKNICPITGEPIRCPLTCIHNQHFFHFEKNAIVRWLKKKNIGGEFFRNPTTNEWLLIDSLFFNVELSQVIENQLRELENKEKETLLQGKSPAEI